MRDAGGATRWRMLALLAVWLGTFLHVRVGLRHASLWVEDGSVLLQRSYQEFSLADWVTPYAGYASLVPSALASLLCRLPATWIPCAFVMAAWTFSVVTYTELLSRRWQELAPMWLRLVAAMALAWAPFGNWALSSLLINVQWSALFWLLLLVVPAAAARRHVTWGTCALAVVLAWSHPLSCVVLAGSGFRSRRLCACLAVAIVGYVLFAVHRSGAMDFGHAFRTIVPYVACRVLFEGAFGLPAKLWLLEHGAVGALWLGAASVCAVLVWGVYRAWSSMPGVRQRAVVALLITSVLLPAASLVSRGDLVTWDEPWGQRYAYAARGCVLLVMLLSFGTFVRPRVLIVLLAAWIALQWPMQRKLRRIGPEPSTGAFLDHLATEERRLGDRRPIDAHLERGDWPIHITPK